MEAILRAKLVQHPEVAEALAQSGDEDIVEDSPVDYFWGEGADGSGQNMLGKLWMKIRAEYHATSPNNSRSSRTATPLDSSSKV